MPTAVGMPAHYDMLVSHSPPVFSHSPPAGFLSDYGANSRLYDPSRSIFRPQTLRSQAQTKRSMSFPLLKPATPSTVPIRSCLVTKTDSTDTTDSSYKNGKTKKRVVFADDYGHALTEIRIMSEPSNVPPLWSLEFLSQVTRGMTSPNPPEQWAVQFRQPASDYLEFKRKLDSKNVSLENVIVKELESVVVGTIKVRNLSFHKEVIVRASWNDWQSQEDTFCTYSQIVGSSGAYVIYDTFSFKLTLPPSSNRKLEFCVCFRCDDKEYWDNNDGKNYAIVKRTTNYTADQSKSLDLATNPETNKTVSAPIGIPSKYADLTQAKVASWSEFASWNHLENNCPYW